MARRNATTMAHLVNALRSLDPKDPAWDAIGDAIVALTGGDKVVTAKAKPSKVAAKPKASKPKAKRAAKPKASKPKTKKQAKPAEVIDLDAERRSRPTKWVKGKWELHACGAMVMLDTWNDVLRAVAHFSPEVMVSTKRPDGTWRFRNAVASEVVKLGKPLAASLRSKAQARRAR